MVDRASLEVALSFARLGSTARTRARYRRPPKRMALATGAALVLSAVLGADPAPGPGQASHTTVGAFSGTVPDGTCRAAVIVLGGAGGSSTGRDASNNLTTGSRGGSPARIAATFAVVPLQTYSGSVGGGGAANRTGGTGGGGTGGLSQTSTHPGAGGGGRSVLSFAGQQVVIAGGGGGGGGGHVDDPRGHGGAAGIAVAPGVVDAGSNGADGADDPTSNTVGAGSGGGVSVGGAGGSHSGGSLNGTAGGDAVALGVGGDGATDTNADTGGGGGAGYTGGGGGASTAGQGPGPPAVGGAGGGGGSSWVASGSPVIGSTVPTNVSGVLDPQTALGQISGANGSVIIDWLPCLYNLGVTKTVSSTTPAPGATVTWTVSVINNGPDPMTKGDTLDLADTLPGGPTSITSMTVTGGSNPYLVRDPIVCSGVTVGQPMPATTTCSRPFIALAGTPGLPTGGQRGLDVGERLTITYTQQIPLGTAQGTVWTNIASLNDRPTQTSGSDAQGVVTADSATQALTVGAPAPVVDAVNDPAVTIPSAGGTVPAVVVNDTVDGAPAVIGTNALPPTLVNNGGLAGLVMNADGTLTVPPGTTPGTYTVTYQLCSSLASSVCDTATVTITVSPSPQTVDAVNDPPVTMTTSGGTVPTVVANDTINGAPAVVGTNALPPTLVNNGGLSGLTINADGTLTVPSGTAPGVYTITYRLCSSATPSACDTATVAVTIATQQVAVEKRAGDPVVVGPNQFEIPYTIVVSNPGTTPLTNVQAWDSLSTTFAEGSPAIAVPSGVSATGVGGATASQCAANGGFTGIGGVPSSATQLLSGSSTLSAQQGCSIAFTVRVEYASAAAFPRGRISNRAEAGSFSTPGGTRLASGRADADVVLRLPRVDITKALVSLTQVGAEPAFDLTYRFVVRNTTDIPARNVQVIDDLKAVFSAGNPSIQVMGGPTLEDGSAPLTVAAGSNAYDGVTRTAMLAGTDTMASGTDRTIRLNLRIRFASPRQIPEGLTLSNIATATTSSPTGAIISADESTDATLTSSGPQAGDVPGPTIARLNPAPQLSLTKLASARAVEIGDTVSYAVRVSNLAGPSLPATTVADRLPLGFRYVPGSARLLSASGTPQSIADPSGSPGPALSFAIPAQPGMDSVTLTYRVRVGPGALQGNGVNAAEATTVGAAPAKSNIGRARVIVAGGVFTTDACIVGKVFADVNGNHSQDKDELGIPGVHVRLEEGTALVSDAEGKYSFCGLTPATHVLKVDRHTLPVGARLTESSNRNAGDPGSLFVDLKFGEVRRADFIEGSADPKVLAQIVERRARGEVWTPIFQTDRISPAMGSETQNGSVSTPDLERSLVPELTPETSNLPESRPRSAGSDSVVGEIRMSTDRVEAPSDGASPVSVTIRLVDRNGQLVTTPVVATVESNGGDLQLPGRQTTEGGADRGDAMPDVPGTQVRIENGVGTVQLVAPPAAQHVRVRVSAGETAAEQTITFVPAPRPMVAVGLVEGRMALTTFDRSSISPARASEAFDRELQRFTRQFADGRGLVGGRSAMFVKGTLKRDFSVTMAYDSDKEDRGVLFRDIQPEAFYPIYGDASVKSFDARTSGPFYLRVDRGRSYLLYGDLQTMTTGSTTGLEARSLGVYSRTLTGVQQHYERRQGSVNVFVSHDSLSQVIDEIAGMGTSGPYSVSRTNGVTGTEKVEIVTRDRNQPSVILRTVPLARFTDYEFEPFSGRLLFKRPIPSLDERLNPMSVRVTYEVDRGGDKAWVGGLDGQAKLGRYVQVGGSWAEDRTPGTPYRLWSLNSTARLGRSAVLVAETAESHASVAMASTVFGGNQASAGSVDGRAARVEIRQESARLSARAFAGASDPNFVNPASTLTGGRTELGARATLAVTEPVRIVGEVLRSEDRLTGGHREGGLLGVEARVAKAFAVEVGMRRSTETATPAQASSAGMPLFGSNAGAFGGFSIGSTVGAIDPITGLPLDGVAFRPQLSGAGGPQPGQGGLDVLTLRAKATYAVNTTVSLFAEAEQDVRDSEKKLAAIGGHASVTDRTRVYLRHEFLSSLGGPYGLSDQQRNYNTVFGASSTYLKNADVFSEYRLRDAMSGREALAAVGLRNLWPLAEGVNLSTTVERLHAIAGADREATAASAGLEYTRSQNLKGTGRVEWRRDPAAESWLSTVGLARKLSQDWTLLTKNYAQVSTPDRGQRQVQDRFWIGGAYRDTATNVFNLLSRYEFRFDDTLGLPPGLATRRDVHAMSTHVDVHPSRPWTFSGQHAAKWVDDRSDTPAVKTLTHLLSGRVGYDVTPRIDLGLLSSLLWNPRESDRRYALGGEVGVRVRDNLWLSGGYNVTGFVDRDFTTDVETTRGAFVRLRMKFDEDLFKRSDRRSSR